MRGRKRLRVRCAAGHALPVARISGLLSAVRASAGVVVVRIPSDRYRHGPLRVLLSSWAMSSGPHVQRIGNMDALERAAAELGIRAAKARYAQGVDSGDWELFASAFAENAVWDLRGWAVARNPVTGEWNGDNCSVGLELLESLDSVLPWPIEGRAAIKSAVEGGSGDEQLE